MARKIKALKGIFGLIRLVTSNPNIKFTSNFFNKGQRDGYLTLNTAIPDYKIKDREEVYGNQRTVLRGGEGGGCR